MDIKAKVNKLVRFYKTRDPFEMIKGMNVILVNYPLEGVRGFYQYFQRNNLIYLDDRLSENERRFVLAQEPNSTPRGINPKQTNLLWNCYCRMKF